jgi:regulator of protease activity HflC (stomatin/prohibitin superfamily)
MLEMFLIPSIALLFLFVYFVNALNIVPEYERGVIFRLGRLLPEAKGPGVVFAFWPIDRIVRVGLRTVTLDVPPQDVITRDNVTVSVNAVVYFRVLDPRLAIVEVENYLYATSQLAQTTLRSVCGERSVRFTFPGKGADSMSAFLPGQNTAIYTLQRWK